MAKHGLSVADVDHWVAHPGGPKVISALEKGLGLNQSALQLTKESLTSVGNLSSASVLAVLEKTCELSPKPKNIGLLFALGPGFCAEMVLLKW